jgi:hypothetical protein
MEVSSHGGCQGNLTHHNPRRDTIMEISIERMMLLLRIYAYVEEEMIIGPLSNAMYLAYSAELVNEDMIEYIHNIPSLTMKGMVYVTALAQVPLPTSKTEWVVVYPKECCR